MITEIKGCDLPLEANRRKEWRQWYEKDKIHRRNG